ncbi:MAG: ribosome-binding factor A [Rickettsiaceae bacterium]|nr:ribosome-binding factor A [Rickettsiaceae bacterium]
MTVFSTQSLKRSARASSSSHRQLKVSGLIKLAIIEALQRGRVKDLRLINNPVTITHVDVTSDLQIANCYILPFGKGGLTKEELLDAFEVSKYDLRKIVTSKVALKYSPELRFFYDHDFDNASDVLQFLQSNNSGVAN